MSVLCYIDTETTGLDPRIHQPYEVCWWREDEDGPTTAWLPHGLQYADAAALRIGAYFDRGFRPEEDRNDYWRQKLTRGLHGVTLVGSNPAFDAAMLIGFIGAAVWHYRMIDVSNVAMVTFDLDRPPGLASVCEMLTTKGYDIPEPDHTAEGDVRTTRAAYEALRAIREGAS